MLTRVMCSSLALLSFAVVCLSGLLRGHSFASVITGSLVALVVGAVAGALASVAVRIVVAENFDNRVRRQPDAAPAPNEPAKDTRTAKAGSEQAEIAAQRDPETAATTGN